MGICGKGVDGMRTDIYVAEWCGIVAWVCVCGDGSGIVLWLEIGFYIVMLCSHCGARAVGRGVQEWDRRNPWLFKEELLRAASRGVDGGGVSWEFDCVSICGEDAGEVYARMECHGLYLIRLQRMRIVLSYRRALV